jgi:Effector-associated domain 11
MSQLNTVIETVKSHIGEGMIEPAIVFLEKTLSRTSPLYNDLVQIKSRFNSRQRDLLLGMIEHREFDLARNNISQALLLLADDIKESDLGDADGMPGESEDKRGDILYNIPDHMQLGRDEKCTVRIAFALTSLLREWERTQEDVIKDIRISDIMGVQLLNLDDNDPPFLIKTLSEQVQFIDKDDFTEWLYYVKPLKAGQYPLMLRVSVIEMINNKEYKKDIVLEERVTVSSEAPPAPASVEFKPAGAALAFGTGAPPSALESLAPPTRAAAADSPVAQPSGSTPELAPPPEKKKRLFGALMVTAALAAVTYFGVTNASNNVDDNPSGGPSGPMVVVVPEKDDPALPPTSAADTGLIAGVVDEPPGQITGAVPPLPKPERETASIKKRPGTKPEKQNSGKVAPVQQPKTVDPSKQVDPPKSSAPDTLPAKKEEPSAQVLRGNRSFFKIPRFRIVQSERQVIDFFFFQYNEFHEVSAIVSCLGDALLRPGMELEFVTAKGDPVKASFKYVARVPDTPKRFDGYFTLNAADVKRLSDEKVKNVRIIDRQNQVLYPFKLAKDGMKLLNKRAEEALKRIK